MDRNFCKSGIIDAMAKLTNYQLWEMGTPLSDAWLEFASEEDKARHAKIQNYSYGNNIYFKENISIFTTLMSSISLSFNSISEIGKIHSEMKESLLVELFNKHLQAFAYRIEPSSSRSPVRIESDKFRNNDPNWNDETLDARGFRYSEIRIVDPAQTGNAAKPRKGRKGSSEIIRKTIAELIGEKFDLCGIDRKLACLAIQDRIGNKFPKGSGLSEQNLRKYILEVCKKREIE